MDVEDCGDLAAAYAIPAMPSLLFFEDGEVMQNSDKIFHSARMVPNLYCLQNLSHNNRKVYFVYFSAMVHCKLKLNEREFCLQI